MKHILLTISLIFGATAVIASDVEQAWLFTELEIYESDPEASALGTILKFCADVSQKGELWISIADN